jgi:hypothetical protein
MKQNHRRLLAFILLLAGAFILLNFSSLYNKVGSKAGFTLPSSSVSGFTPRLRAAVRPHVRTFHRGANGFISVFSWDNWRRGLRQLNLL